MLLPNIIFLASHALQNTTKQRNTLHVVQGTTDRFLGNAEN